MRSHEERVAETKRRIAKIEREKRQRRNTITMASAVAACLVLLIGASLAMPGIAARHHRPATTPALKRRPASFTAALPWDTSSSGFWRFYLACA